MAEISANIFEKCLPAISTDIERCGAITACEVSPTTSAELDSIYKDEDGRWRTIGALLEADFVGKACQIKQNGMYDLISATRRDFGAQKLTSKKIKHGWYMIEPFVLMERKGIINNEFWSVSSGAASSGTLNGEAYTHTFDLLSQTSIPNDTRWFPAKLRVFISGKTGGGTSTRTSWKVVGSAIVSGKIRIYTTSENAASFLDAAHLAVPATGVLMRGTPNVADTERYCTQAPGLNTNQLVPFWVETVRYSLCEDDLTNKYLQAIREGNPYFKKFGDVESVELNRQIIEDWQKRDAYSFFFNKPLENQTLAAWNDLDEILYHSDSAAGDYLYLPFEGKCAGRRANAIGVYELLAECGRVKDLQAQVLNIPELQLALYKIKRQRESLGLDTKVIEILTDSAYAVQLAQGFLRYFKVKSEGLLRLNQELSSKNNEAPFGFYFTKFQLDYPNVELRIVTHKFFDDLLEAHTNISDSMESAGRMLWILDWSTIYRGMIASNTVTNRSGDIGTISAVNEDFLCVMQVPRKSQKMVSQTYTNVVECPAASLLLENISFEIPEHEFKAGEYDDYYGNDESNDA